MIVAFHGNKWVSKGYRIEVLIVLYFYQVNRFLTCCHESRFNGSRRPVRVASLHIGSSSTSVWTRHGRAGDNVEIHPSAVLAIDGRMCKRWPGSEDVHARGSDIRLYHPFKISSQVKSSTVTELAVLLIIAIESVGYLENIWGDRVWSSRRKWYNWSSHDILPTLSNQNSCDRIPERIMLEQQNQ